MGRSTFNPGKSENRNMASALLSEEANTAQRTAATINPAFDAVAHARFGPSFFKTSSPIIQREPDKPLLNFLKLGQDEFGEKSKNQSNMLAYLQPISDDEDMVQTVTQNITSIAEYGLKIIEDDMFCSVVPMAQQIYFRQTLMDLMKAVSSAKADDIKTGYSRLRTFLEAYLNLTPNDATGIKEIGDALIEQGFEIYVALGGSADPVSEYLEMMGKRVCNVAASGITEQDAQNNRLKFITKSYLIKGGLVGSDRKTIVANGKTAVLDAVSNGSALRVMKSILLEFGFTDVHAVALNRKLALKEDSVMDGIEQLKTLTAQGEDSMKKIGDQYYKEHPLLVRKFAKFDSKAWETQYNNIPTENPEGKSKYQALIASIM